mmetsp:Transcript_20576/g.48495  ORF Transcript_20576/g.48495 Transcript_20576/m.48495 type:complete len:259 (-) Transcript_20576:432-1208(-)
MSHEKVTVVPASSSVKTYGGEGLSRVVPTSTAPVASHVPDGWIQTSCVSLPRSSSHEKTIESPTRTVRDGNGVPILSGMTQSLTRWRVGSRGAGAPSVSISVSLSSSSSLFPPAPGGAPPTKAAATGSSVASSLTLLSCSCCCSFARRASSSSSAKSWTVAAKKSRMSVRDRSEFVDPASGKVETSGSTKSGSTFDPKKSCWGLVLDDDFGRTTKSSACSIPLQAGRSTSTRRGRYPEFPGPIRYATSPVSSHPILAT